MEETLQQPESPTAATHGANDRLSKIRHAVDEVLNLEESGQEYSDRDLRLRYRELLPELLDELQIARRIRSAMATAKGVPHSPESLPTEDTDDASPLESIRAALPELEIIERLDQGGQGIIYKAIEVDTKRLVAIKVLRDGPQSSQSQRERFAREAEIVSQMHHPNIVSLYRSGALAKHQFFVMEYVDGIPIDDYVLYHALPVRQVVQLFEKVCRAVSCAHQSAVVHRDLKPGNILVDLDGEPHLLDFGLAKDTDAATTGLRADRISLTGQLLGTLPFASPEQASGLAAGVDTRSDVYSLGVILYLLLTGKMPYPVDGAPEVIRTNIISRPADSLRAASKSSDPVQRGTVGAIADDLERIVLRALAKEKHRRYPTADALADDLKRFLDGHAVIAKSDSQWYLIRKAIARHRLVAALALAFVLMLVAGLVSVTILWRHAEHVGRVAQAGLEMGSYIKLGSVARDSGRSEQAIGMFEKAVQLGQAVATDNSTFNERDFSANFQLAEMLYDREGSARAKPFADAAIRIAEGLYQSEPGNMEWQRLLAFSQLLKAKEASLSKNYVEAVKVMNKAVALRMQLLAQNADNESLRGELAHAIAIQGRYLRLWGKFDRALSRYNAAYQLYLDLAARKPRSVDRLLDVSITENRIATLHLSLKTSTGNKDAAKWLSKADKSAARASSLPGAEDCSADLGRLRNAINRNIQLIAKRESQPATNELHDLSRELRP
jgi:tRNA A-37 threonylcarbamoyl transferase component Bud32/tetratricopeptide (TPR) repeat protein